MAPFLGPDGQGNRDFSRYYADFVRLVTVLQCDEGTQQRALERGLSAELQSSLRYQDVPASETLTAYADRIKRLDGSIRRDKVFSAPPCAAAVPATRPPPTTGNIAWPPANPSSRPRQPLSPEGRARPPCMAGAIERESRVNLRVSECKWSLARKDGGRPPSSASLSNSNLHLQKTHKHEPTTKKLPTQTLQQHKPTNSNGNHIHY